MFTCDNNHKKCRSDRIYVAESVKLTYNGPCAPHSVAIANAEDGERATITAPITALKPI